MTATGKARLSVRQLESEREVRVAFAGELDLAEVDRAIAAIEAAEAREPRLLVMDLTELAFLDSTGVKLLIDIEARARCEQRHLRLLVGPEAARVLDLVGLADYFDIVRRG